ncbi:hypothetical protein [Bacillus sp. 165]|uniref:hypothetical protein n=1 Tax=Bacillus sp. 165 TaxID=1529117 RepID=UPI001AD9D1CD|nr:hypothetical protein [Bacillus sp. 165]MBO9129980.1 hypothetical protein [Bacillus sp. 165]
MKQRIELLFLSLILTIITLFMSGAGDKIQAWAYSKKRTVLDNQIIDNGVHSLDSEIHIK